MNIQSTKRSVSPVSIQRAGKQEYQKAKEEFTKARDDHYEAAETYTKWGGRASFASGAAALAGVAYLTYRLAPGLEGYGAAFPAVFAGFGVGAAVNWSVNQMLQRSETTTSMMEARERFVEQRDSYRNTLLSELADEGVAATPIPLSGAV